MHTEFLTEEQKNRYGRYNEAPSEEQLVRYFHLDDTDLDLLSDCRGDSNRFGFVLQLTTARFLGAFLTNPIEVPEKVVQYLGNQLEIKRDLSFLEEYLERKATRYSHRDKIREFYGYQDFVGLNRFRLIRWLYSRTWMYSERPSLLFDLATSYLVERKILLPAVSTLTRLIAQIRDRSEKRLWKRMASLLSFEQKSKIETLLLIPSENRRSLFDQLRKGPVRVSGPSLVSALKRYQTLKNFEIQKTDLSSIPLVKVQVLARYASTAWAATVTRMPEERRVATLIAFLTVFETSALDDAIDLLDMLITDIAKQAKSLAEKKRLRTLKDLDQAAIALRKACTIILDDTYKDESLRKAIFASIARSSIEDAVITVDEIARPRDDRFYQELVERYRRVRVFLPSLLKIVSFQATASGKPVLKALQFLSHMKRKRILTLKDVPLGVVSSSWRRLVINKGEVNLPAYTLCVLEKFQDSLHRRDIFVPESGRWGDTRTKLLTKESWEKKRAVFCRSLGHSQDIEITLDRLKSQLDMAYHQAANHFARNEALRIEEKNKKPSLVLTPLDEIKEPNSLVELRERVSSLLPRIDLTEILLEINAHTGFTEAFTHITESRSRIDHLPISVSAVLIAEACNIGLEPLVKPNNPILSRDRLSWVQQNYFRAETLTQANASLVDYQSKLSLAKIWGGGEVASADGLRFVTPLRTINAGYNPKYFGSKKGITYYNYTSDQFTGFHGIVIPGTLKDSIYILEGLLEQQTSLQPAELMADTAGVSNLIFGLFWLLGYQFSPRLADICETILSRIDPDASYGVFDQLPYKKINVSRIKENLDDMFRVACSLKIGTVSASELIRSLLRSDRPSSLTRAISELGKIPKTTYMLNYIDDEAYRRRILSQINRGEGRHSLARFICHGQRGEIRKRYREGQEDQLSALGLVTNAVVLWNTMYIQKALDKLKQDGLVINEEDVARLSPLQYKHINVLGHYSFNLSEEVVRGELRKLHLTDYE